MFDLDENKPAKKKSIGKIWLSLKIGGAVLVVLAVVACALFLGRSGKEAPEPEPVITSELLKGQLSAIQELGTAAYYYTGVGKFENQNEFFGWKVPFTGKSFIITYDGVIKAGVDLSDVDVTVDEARKTVMVILPDSKFLSHEIDEDSIQVLDESNGLFNPITIEDYVGFSSEQKEGMEQRAIDSGLLKEASENAYTMVDAFLSLVPGIEDYHLTLRASI